MMISVNERLPEDGQTCIVLWKSNPVYGPKSGMDFARYSEVGGEFAEADSDPPSDGPFFVNVTHWKPWEGTVGPITRHAVNKAMTTVMPELRHLDVGEKRYSAVVAAVTFLGQAAGELAQMIEMGAAPEDRSDE